MSRSERVPNMILSFMTRETLPRIRLLIYFDELDKSSDYANCNRLRHNNNQTKLLIANGNNNVAKLKNPAEG